MTRKNFFTRCNNKTDTVSVIPIYDFWNNLFKIVFCKCHFLICKKRNQFCLKLTTGAYNFFYFTVTVLKLNTANFIINYFSFLFKLFWKTIIISFLWKYYCHFSHRFKSKMINQSQSPWNSILLAQFLKVLWIYHISKIGISRSLVLRSNLNVF